MANVAKRTVSTSTPKSVAALFGDDSDSQPLWFKKDTFLEDSFESDAYVADLRRFVPLDTLRVELQSHLSSLKSELVELINRDYTDFVNLSTKLVDVDGAVLRMRMPLNDLRTKLLGVKECLSAALSSLKSGLERRGEASNARNLLELLLDTSHVLSKVEKLLLELQSMPLEESKGNAPTSEARTQSAEKGNGEWDEGTAPGESGGSAVCSEESRSRFLERIASEMNRLKFYTARVQAMPFVQSMEKRSRQAEATLSRHLSQLFSTALQRKDRAVLFHCLRAYAALDDAPGAELAFRQALVGPTVASALAPADAVSETAGDHLAGAYAELAARLEDECRFLLDMVFAANSGLSSFEFLANGILREVQAGLKRERPGAFSPGKPDAFLANYKASLDFLSFLEGFCPTQKAVVAFRAHPAYAEFLKSWNLGVYFNLRFREIAGSLDSVLNSPSLLHSSTSQPGSFQEGAPGFSLEGSSVLWRSLIRCWDADVSVSSVSDKFLKLTLQLVARYATWIQAGITAHRQSAVSSSSEEGSPQGGDGNWGSSASMEDLILVLHDVDLLADLIAGPRLAGILPSVLGPCVPSELVSSAELAVKGSASYLLTQRRGLVEALTEGISENCIEVLRHLKGISATYRMTNKPMPTRFSLYVTGVLQPLKVFLEGPKADRLSKAGSEEIVKFVVERVTQRFDEMANELVVMAKKTESSLMRFRRDKQKAATESDSPQFSDTEKMKAQLFLDVQEFGRQLSLFRVNPTEVPSFVSLWKCVAPESQKMEF